MPIWLICLQNVEENLSKSISTKHVNYKSLEKSYYLALK